MAVTFSECGRLEFYVPTTTFSDFIGIFCYSVPKHSLNLALWPSLQPKLWYWAEHRLQAHSSADLVED